MRVSFLRVEPYQLLEIGGGEVSRAAIVGLIPGRLLQLVIVENVIVWRFSFDDTEYILATPGLLYDGIR